MPVDLTTLLSAIIGQTGGKFVTPLPNPLDGGRPFSLQQGRNKPQRTGSSGQTGNVSFSIENNDVIKPIVDGPIGAGGRELLPGAGQDLVDDMRLIAAEMDLSDATVETDKLDKLEKEGFFGSDLFKTLDKGVKSAFDKDRFLSNLPLLAAAAQFSHPFAADGVSPVSIGSKIGDAINAGLKTDATLTRTSALKNKADHGRFQALGDKLFQIKDGKVTEVADTGKTLEQLSAINKAKAEGTKEGKDEPTIEFDGKDISIDTYIKLFKLEHPTVDPLKQFFASMLAKDSPGSAVVEDPDMSLKLKEFNRKHGVKGLGGESTATSPTGLTDIQKRIAELKAKRGIQ